jgi:hypothetical protein
MATPQSNLGAICTPVNVFSSASHNPCIVWEGQAGQAPAEPCDSSAAEALALPRIYTPFDVARGFKMHF